MSVLAGAETSQALRPLSSRQRVLQRSDGSSHWCQGRTEIVCGVYGPRSAPKKQERVEGAELVVLVQPANGAHTVAHSRLSQWLRSVLVHSVMASLHPRTQVVVAVHIVHDDGALAAAMINATTLALLDAAIPLRCSPVAVELRALKSGETLIDAPLALATSKTDETVLTSTYVFDSQGAVLAETTDASTLGNADDRARLYWELRSVASSAASRLVQFIELTSTAKCLYEARASAPS